MARPCGRFAVSHGPQLPSHGLRGDRDTELVPDPLDEIYQPPAHCPMGRRNRAALDHLGKRLALCLVELRRLPRRLTTDKTGRANGVEPQHPVTHRLRPDAASPGLTASRPPALALSIRQCPSRKTLVVFDIRWMLNQVIEAAKVEVPNSGQAAQNANICTLRW